MRTSGLTLVCLSIAGLGCSSPTGSDEGEGVGWAGEGLSAGSAVLRNKSKAVFWSGSVGPEDAPSGGEPPECAEVPCDHFRLRLDLPRGTFRDKNRPGGLQVAIRWNGEFDTLHLWVYKDGVLRAASPGIIATAQSTFLPEPENGIYDVWIAYDPTFNIHPSVSYEALAEVEYKAKIKPVRRLLPDLEFRSTQRITFDTPSFPIFEPDPPPGATCFNSEVEEDGAQTCLRFDQIIANLGKGPVELWFTVPAGSSESEFDVVQRVHSSNGTTADQPGGSVEFHPIHGHYHYSSFATSALWLSNAQGTKLGSAPVTDGQKVSFCVADIRIDAWGEKGDGPRTYMAPDCLFPAISDPSGDQFKQGLTTGWDDVYDWYLPDQYLEVTGVADGFYRLEFCADPDNSIQEEDESNNCVTDLIRLTNMGTPQRHVEFIRQVSDGKHH